MESGPSISPVTLRPKQLHDKDQSHIRAVAKEKTLREQAENLDIAQSDIGQHFLDVISSKLQVRITQLIREDPESVAYEKILTDLGFKYNAAKKAVDELYRRQFA
ncbi:MAG: hypothetical protein ABIL06_13255 [Pseudomonadota bacterium]|uniref:Uncharacterized protein n=1 Tax=viral metagenome TaxID=1070528 RepID=A0A6H1ZHW1_9ZZZZ